MRFKIREAKTFDLDGAVYACEPDVDLSLTVRDGSGLYEVVDAESFDSLVTERDALAAERRTLSDLGDTQKQLESYVRDAAKLAVENTRLVAERDVLKTDLTECYGQPHCSVMDRTSHRFQIDSARAVAEELTVENTRLTQELEAAAGDKCLHCSHGDKPQRDEDEIWRHRFGNANHRPYFCAAGPMHERRHQASEQANQPTKTQQLTRERDTLRTAIVTTIRNLVDGVSKSDILTTLERVLEHGA